MLYVITRLSQITNVLYKMGSELQSVVIVMPYKRVKWLNQWYKVLGECGVCALWLSDGEINTRGHCIRSQNGKGEHNVCKLGEFDHRVAPV